MLRILHPSNVRFWTMIGLVALLALPAAASIPGPPGETVVEEVPGAPGAVARSWDLEILVRSFRYESEDTHTPVVVVPAGTVVRWKWDLGLPTSPVAHSVTSGLSHALGPDGQFDSGLRTDAQEVENGGNLSPFTVRFTEPGEYPYYCRFLGPGDVPFHEAFGMRGVVVVV
jgi:plastocyanin